MDYRKVISYADILEIYEYEKRPASSRGNNNRPQISDVQQGIPFIGEASLPKEESPKVREKRSVQRAILAFRRLVRANLQFAENPILVTLTYAENEVDWKSTKADFNAFARNLRFTFGSKIRYITVTEFQKRGAIHFHTLLWGVPVSVVRAERDTRLVASLWGKGFVYLKETDGHPKLSSYLVKYFNKQMEDPRLIGKKLYIASQNIIKPVIDKNAMLSPYFHLSTYRPLYQNEFMTPWLGKGRYRRLQQIIIPIIKNGNSNNK